MKCNAIQECHQDVAASAGAHMQLLLLQQQQEEENPTRFDALVYTPAHLWPTRLCTYTCTCRYTTGSIRAAPFVLMRCSPCCVRLLVVVCVVAFFYGGCVDVPIAVYAFCFPILIYTPPTQQPTFYNNLVCALCAHTQVLFRTLCSSCCCAVFVRAVCVRFVCAIEFVLCVVRPTR